MAQENTVKDLALFAEVPDAEAPRLASTLLIMATPFAIKGKTKDYLGTVTTAAMLHTAARSLFSDCPVGHRPSLQNELPELLRLLKEKHGSRLRRHDPHHHRPHDPRSGATTVLRMGHGCPGNGGGRQSPIGRLHPPWPGAGCQDVPGRAAPANQSPDHTEGARRPPLSGE